MVTRKNTRGDCTSMASRDYDDLAGALVPVRVPAVKGERAFAG